MAQLHVNSGKGNGHSGAGSLDTETVHQGASYGKACLNCVKSKTRCGVSPTGGKCERCDRLHKDCQPAPVIRKKRISKRPGPSTSSKTALLEEKLDGIVQMLQRSQGTQIQEPLQPNYSNSSIPVDQIPSLSCDNDGKDTVPLGSLGLQTNSSYGEFITGHPQNDLKGNPGGLSSTGLNYGGQVVPLGHVNAPPTPAPSITYSSTPSDRNVLAVDYPLETEAELEECLENYRTNMVPYFPIVCIAPEVTVESLRRERPFLFLVIRAICSKNLARQAALGLQLKKHLGREMLIEGSKNLDLFLGVLVFASWCHYYIFNKPIASTVIQLGISLALDMSLTRPPQVDPLQIMQYHNYQGCPRSSPCMNVVRTLEERRAAVGLFLVSSISANYFQRIELMRWTPYLEGCLNLLAEQKEYPTDILLVYLIRVQIICNKAAASTWNDVFGEAGVRVPANFYVKALETQLDELQRTMPSEMKANKILQMHILSTTLTIHEHSLNSLSNPPSSDPSHQLTRITNLWICLTAIKSWLELFFDLSILPLSTYPYLSMALLAQNSQCLVTLFRLSTFESVDGLWDRQRVLQECNLGEQLRITVERWDAVPEAAGIEDAAEGEGDHNPWAVSSKRFQGILTFWNAKVAAADGEKRGVMNGNGVVSGVDDAIGEVATFEGVQGLEGTGFPLMDMDMMDDTWMRDLLGGGFEFSMESYF